MSDYAVSNGHGLDLKDSLFFLSGWEPLDLVNTTNALLSVTNITSLCLVRVISGTGAYFSWCYF